MARFSIRTFAFLLLLVVLLLQSTTTVRAESLNSTLLTWFLSEEGTFFDSKRQHVVLPSHGEDYGVTAREPIAAGDTLARIPWNLVLQSEKSAPKSPDEEDAQFDCGTARKIVKEWIRGKDSRWFLVLRHLEQLAVLNPLPSMFSTKGKELFLDILGGEGSPELLMDNAVHYGLWDWEELCDESPETAPIAMFAKQFSLDNVLIPIKDLYTHRNGKFHNVDMKISPGEPVEIVAKRNIEAGEKLHISLNRCNSCNMDEEDSIDTPELFRDHGIMEQMPQIWIIPEATTELVYEDENGEELVAEMSGLTMKFQLDEDETGTIGADLLFEDIESPLYPFIDTLFRQRIQALHHMKNIELPETASEFGIPEWEWNSIWKFHAAYTEALKRATFELDSKTARTALPSDQQAVPFFRDVNSWEDHYTDFHVELDHIAYNEARCESSEMVDFLSYQPYELERSNYQEMLWQYRAEDDDTCLHLDNMLQICSSYRPHYHEFFVHFPARYLNSIERVIYLGSGDAMLLHEILKYPSLKKVVGLELDQTVTRKSFKHFKTQPHFDDPRVEWWYGDATKTLPLLPRDYWGSFDLLLVDLSETVVSLHVTGQHDVLDVISMLLKPEGVMLENELYIDKMSKHFDNTVHIFYGSPKVCIQVHTVSSNSVDFLRTPVNDHEVDTYLMNKVENESERFRFIHDYVNVSPIVQNKCTEAHNLVTTEHGRKSGIMLVLEAENCARLDENLEEGLRQTLVAHGLTAVKHVANDDKGLIQIVMKEGYVQARVHADQNYVGFDIHFWGAFSRMENIRGAIVELVGSTINSSYRVVTGGMQESNTWEDDQHEIGIEFSQKRNCTEPKPTEVELDRNEVTRVALDESIFLRGDSASTVIAVVCGVKSAKDNCAMLNMLRESPKVSKVIPLWACEDIPAFNDGSYPFSEMYNCEKSMIDQIEKFDERLDMFVVDMDAPLSMLQIFASVWNDYELRDNAFAQEYAVAMPAKPEMHRRGRFMDLFRKFGHGEAASMAEFKFAGTESSIWRVFSHGSEDAIRSIVEMEKNLKVRLPALHVELGLIEGGQLHAERDLVLETRSFVPEDYDYGPNQLQAKEQRPLGRQTIFQFEVAPGSHSLQKEEILQAFTTSMVSVTDAPAIELFGDVGRGIVLTTSFQTGSSVLMWDGASHLDINLFRSDESKSLADSFLQAFLDAIENHVQISLRDDQPRGYGRVVNFQSDIDRDNMAAIQR